MTNRSISYAVLVILSVIGVTGYPQNESQGKSSGSSGTFEGFKLVDNSGIIRKPADYRDNFQILGSWTVLDPKGNQMHFTYASPGAAAYYRKNGKMADGTVLVKEVFGTDHGQMTTGDAHWATRTIQWFVMVKD
jgi:hypothetical protein